MLEFAGLAPTVFTGMVLADYGADVTIISKPDGDSINTPLNRGKRSVTLDLKKVSEV